VSAALQGQPLIMHLLAPNTSFGSGAQQTLTDMTNRVHTRYTFKRGQQYERSQAAAGSYSATWRNNDGALDPKNSSSPYFPGIDLYAPLEVVAQYPRTQQLLTGDQATAGEVTPLSPGAIPASMNISAALGTPVIAASASAWQGTQVYATPVPASGTIGFSLLALNFVPIQATTSAAPATSYAWSVYVRSVTSGANPSAAAQIRWFNVAGTQVGTSTGTTTALAAGGASAAWTRLSVAGTPPAGAIYANVAVNLAGSAPTGAWSCQTDGLQVEWGTSASTWILPGTWYPMWGGALSEVPREYSGDGTPDSAGNFSVVRIKATDVLGVLAQGKLNDCFINTLLGYAPNFLYALNEATTQVGTNPTFADLTGQRGNAVTVATTVSGDDIETVAGVAISNQTGVLAGTEAGTFLGTNGPTAQLANTYAVGTNPAATYSALNLQFAGYSLNRWIASGISLAQPGSIGPAPSSAWTRVVAFQMQSAKLTFTPGSSGNGSPYLRCAVWACVGPAPNEWPQVSVSAYVPITYSGGIETFGTEYVLFEAWNAAGTYVSEQIFVGNTPTQIDNGYWHLLAVTLSANGQTFTVNIGSTATGATYNFTVSTGGADFRTTSATIYTSDVVGAWSAPWQANNFNYGSVVGPLQYGMNGQLALVADYSFAITSAQFTDMWESFSVGYAGDTYAQRAQRFLTWAGYKGAATLDTGGTTYGAAGGLGDSGSSSTPFTGTDPLSALQPVVLAEWGMMFAANTGAFTLGGRLRRWTQVVPVVTFGEGPPVGAAGEVPYMPPTIGYDNAVLINIAQLTVTNGTVNAPTNPPIGAVNYTSRNKYFPQVVQQTINTATNQEALNLAQWLVNANGIPLDRIGSLPVHVSHTAGAWPLVLPLELDNLIQVNRRPLGGAVLEIPAFTENLAWDIDPSIPSATLTVQASNATLDAPWLVAPVHTTLAAQANAAATTVTISALPDASANELAWSMLPTQQLQFEPGTVRAETVTVVPPLPATAVGYTTATITVTPALAFTHPAGTTVCGPLPAGVTNAAAYDARAIPGVTTIVGF
jgi:hypothetical protein